MSIKETHISYCQICGKDFEPNEKVYYAPTDNNVICDKCSKLHKNREPRVYIKP